jgi:hypothetical protein
MGLVGAIIVRPAMGTDYGYNHADTRFHREVLYFMTEMDPQIHYKVELGLPVDMTTYFATNWFVNGRNWPDVLAGAGVPWLPAQPYNCLPMMHPGEKTLVRYIGAGRDLHPMHFHGNDFDVIAEDGRLLTSDHSRGNDPTGPGPDLAWKATTISSVPGQTADFIWQWMAEKIGWDIYGHAGGETHPIGAPGAGDVICQDYTFALNAAIGAGQDVSNPPDSIQNPLYRAALEDALLDPFNYEYCPDHGVPVPVILPERDSVTYGDVYTGNPFLGGLGDLPPGHAGLNSFGGYFFIWHSHTEKEITSNDIFPGGAITFMIVAPWEVDLD